MENQNSVEETVSYGHNADIVQALKVIIVLIYCKWSDGLFILSLLYYVWIDIKEWNGVEWKEWSIDSDWLVVAVELLLLRCCSGIMWCDLQFESLASK